jgi:hypothetical protein
MNAPAPCRQAACAFGWVSLAAASLAAPGWARGAEPPASPAPPAPPPAAAPAANLVPLDLVLPKPAYLGTPPPVVRPGHAPPKVSKPEPRPPFLVPPGVTNLALHKSVRLSVADPLYGEAAQITDGRKEASDATYVTLRWDLQYVQIDLEKNREIFAVVVWHFHADPRVYHDVVVQLADDPDFVKGVRTVFNNDRDNSAGLGIGRDAEYVETREGKLIDCHADRAASLGTKARYVRLYSNGSTADDLNHYIEVEVYGR